MEPAPQRGYAPFSLREELVQPVAARPAGEAPERGFHLPFALICIILALR